ncbi:MAG: EVE domain-containing protein [Nitrosopumilus sp.]|nr:EVE domain-containing protein [Nitrosopumilus sp.]
MSEFFSDDDRNIVLTPSEEIIQRFRELWTTEEIIELLNEPQICPPDFLESIKEMLSFEGKVLDENEYAQTLYEQCGGDKFLHAKKVNKNFKFLAEFFCAVVRENPGNKDELNEVLERFFPIFRENFDVDEWKEIWTKAGLPEEKYWPDIPLDYSDVQGVDKILTVALQGMGPGQRATSAKFLGRICEITNLPDICSQKEKSLREWKSVDVQPLGDLNPLYDYQRDVSRQLEHMLTQYSDDTSRAMVALPTGSGKTRVVVESIIDWINEGKKGQEDKKFVIWVVDKKELCQQAYETFVSIFQAKGKQDTSLSINSFWADNPKNLYEIFNSSTSKKTSVIIATVGSLNSAMKKIPEAEDDDENTMKKISKSLAILVIDEAHRAINKSYGEVMRGVGFNFSNKIKKKHEYEARLLGLTATPYRNEGVEANLGHKDKYGRYIKSKTEQLQTYFSNQEGKPNFLWPDDANVSFSQTINYPHAILELQQSATFGNDIKMIADKSYDQDGKIVDYYWQVKIKQLFTSRITNPFKYDTGKDCYGLEGDPEENLRKWKENKINKPYKESKNIWAKSGKKEHEIERIVFDVPGKYQVFLWVKDDDGLVSQQIEMRNIEINPAAEKTVIDNQKIMQRIEDELIKDGKLSVPKHWYHKHDSLSYIESQGEKVRYKKLLGRETDEIDDETLRLVSRDPKYNIKIYLIIKKLLEGTGKKKNQEEIKKESILLFVNSIEHAKYISTALRSALKINCRFVTGETHTDERCKIINDFRNKKIQVLVNVDILTTGFDAPQVDAVVIARARLKSYPLWVQMMGRGLRGPQNGGTEECRIVDLNSRLEDENAQYSKEELLEAYRFHSELFRENEELTEYDLGLVKEVKWETGLQESVFQAWKSQQNLPNRDIVSMMKFFTERPEFQEWQPEFWEWLQENYDPERETILEKIEDDAIIIFDESETAEPSSDIPEKTFDEFISYIDTKLIPESLQSNYRPVAIRVLLLSNRKVGRTVIHQPITREFISRIIASENLSKGKQLGFYINQIPVFRALRERGIVKRKKETEKKNDMYGLNLEMINSDQLDILVTKLDKIILKKKHIDAGIKSAETKGPTGLRDAAIKAANTRAENKNQIYFWLYSVTPEKWEIVKEKEIWGVETELRMKKLNKGDEIIFYVKETNQIKGIFKVNSDWRESTELTWNDEKKINQIKYPYQIDLSTVVIGNVIYRNLKDQLNFVEKKENYNMYLQAHITGPSNWGHPLDIHDYELIKNSLIYQMQQEKEDEN